jgi:hypothetical protein
MSSGDHTSIEVLPTFDFSFHPSRPTSSRCFGGRIIEVHDFDYLIGITATTTKNNDAVIFTEGRAGYHCFIY